ncbi:aspartate dehydrogenase [Stella humosa]|uniref:L-aspartate dehydrogenase n=1 Tax=Stella humosa TaxID=94 RepID=A0A3N1MCL9_9PROT|nr:aspartate dehydrogenase domain-containing protein [Stella humosa]ROQ01348.1 aspartate dehydrogenase [Stella humosa]BBK31722.1 putative L-aspartate dehydrogenase [Stella humosa]
MPETMRIGLAGFGNVGQDLARRLTAGAIPEATLVAVSATDLQKAAGNAAAISAAIRVVPLAELAGHCDVVVECATADAFPEIARAVVGAGKLLVAVSVGGLPNCPELLELARTHGGKVKVASGALPGLDIIRSVKEGTIQSVQLTTRLRPNSLAHEPYIINKGFDFSTPPAKAVQVFDGTAGEAAASFPRHFNVAVTLSLGGIGFDRTRVTVYCDPDIAGAIHQVDVEADDASLTLISRNRPSPTNPRTSRIVAPSILAALRGLVDPITVGS